MPNREEDELRHLGISLARKIGSGSFSSVYSATWENEGNTANIAVKIMRLDLIPDERFERFFLAREIDIVTKVNHSNVAKVYECFSIGPSTIILSELYECDLLQYVQARGAINERVARRLLLELCAAIQYLHDLNIVHRDLKTENLFLAKNGQLKLGDFGFARFLDSDNTLCETRCGSDGYIAPEIVNEHKEPIDAKLADIWSIGVILFTIVCKAMPFDPQIMKLMIRRKFVQLRFPSKPQVSGQLKELLAAFLQFCPTNRIPLKNVERHPWYSERQSASLVPEGSDERRNPTAPRRTTLE